MWLKAALAEAGIARRAADAGRGRAVAARLARAHDVGVGCKRHDLLRQRRVGVARIGKLHVARAGLVGAMRAFCAHSPALPPLSVGAHVGMAAHVAAAVVRADGIAARDFVVGQKLKVAVHGLRNRRVVVVEAAVQGADARAERAVENPRVLLHVLDRGARVKGLVVAGAAV